MLSNCCFLSNGGHVKISDESFLEGKSNVRQSGGKFSSRKVSGIKTKLKVREELININSSVLMYVNMLYILEGRTWLSR